MIRIDKLVLLLGFRIEKILCPSLNLAFDFPDKTLMVREYKMAVVIIPDNNLPTFR
jgi:hypothetical protein